MGWAGCRNRNQPTDSAEETFYLAVAVVRMVHSSRGRSLFVQLVAPVVGLVLAGVLANVAFAAWFAGRNAVVMARGDRNGLSKR